MENSPIEVLYNIYLSKCVILSRQNLLVAHHSFLKDLESIFKEYKFFQRQSIQSNGIKQQEGIEPSENKNPNIVSSFKDENNSYQLDSKNINDREFFLLLSKFYLNVQQFEDNLSEQNNLKDLHNCAKQHYKKIKVQLQDLFSKWYQVSDMLKQSNLSQSFTKLEETWKNTKCQIDDLLSNEQEITQTLKEKINDIQNSALNI